MSISASSSTAILEPLALEGKSGCSEKPAGWTTRRAMSPRSSGGVVSIITLGERTSALSPARFRPRRRTEYRAAGGAGRSLVAHASRVEALTLTSCVTVASSRPATSRTTVHAYSSIPDSGSSKSSHPKQRSA
eukprot:6951316-Prymnesium_polylepis.1